MRTGSSTQFSFVTCGVLMMAAGGLAQSSLAVKAGASTGVTSSVLRGCEAVGHPASHASSALVVTDPPIDLKWSKKTVGKGHGGSIALDATGNPHVIFMKDSKELTVLMHGWAEGSHWHVETVYSELFVVGDTAVAFDGKGGMHVVFSTEVPGSPYQLHYAFNNGGGWQTETVEDGGSSNSLVIDEEGFAHIVHCNGAVAGSPSDVRYLKQTATGWDAETISSNGEWSGGSSLLLHDGDVYATFSDLANPGKLFLGIRDATSWSLQEIAEGRLGSLALDQDGVPHVAYVVGVGSDFLDHAWLTQSGWVSETIVSDSTFFGESLPAEIHATGESPALVADSAGRLQLAGGLFLTKGNAQGSGLWCAAFDGVAWMPSLVSPKNIGYGNAAAVDSNGIVHIASEKLLGAGGAVVAARLKGAKLSLSVSPKEAGMISVSPSGLESNGKASELLYPGTEVTLTATPAQGFTFVKWSPASLGTDPVCNVTLDKNRKVAAHFAAAP